MAGHTITYEELNHTEIKSVIASASGLSYSKRLESNIKIDDNVVKLLFDVTYNKEVVLSTLSITRAVEKYNEL